VISPARPLTGPGTRLQYAGRALLTAALLATAIASAHADERVFELAIHSEGPTAKPLVLTVRQNDQVVVRLSSDKPVQVHLHGYDIEKDVVPNVVTPLRFTATATGRFPIEIHSKGPARQRPLAYLEVRPR
jgi:heme/copper-type cytochrome/quinol oxidase subunit 2